MAKEWLFVLMLFRRQRDGLEFGNIEAFDPYEQSGVLRIEDWSELRGGERRNRECRLSREETLELEWWRK